MISNQKKKLIIIMLEKEQKEQIEKISIKSPEEIDMKQMLRKNMTTE